MSQMNRMIQVAIYQLKKQYGSGPVDIHQYTSANVNLSTGQRAEASSVTTIKTAVVLPAKYTREAVRSISVISSDKQFVYGGTFDKTRRMFLIDQRDAPNLNLRKDDWLIFKNRRYDVASFDQFEDAALWVVIANEILGEVPPKIIRVNVTQGINITDSVQGGL